MQSQLGQLGIVQGLRRRRNFKFHSVSGRLSSGGYGGSAGTGTIGSTMGSWNNIPQTKAFCREYSVKERKREGRAGREGKVPTFKKIPLIEALHVYTRYEMDPNVASHSYQAQIWIFLTSLIRLKKTKDMSKKKTSSLGQITFRCKARKRSSEVVFVASACVKSVQSTSKSTRKVLLHMVPRVL